MGVFEDGLCWTYYTDIESEFLHFLEYVPYTEVNRHVHSPKLLALLLRTCGYIDTIFKEMAKYHDFDSIPECKKINKMEKQGYRKFDIRAARNAFEKIYKLSSNNRCDLKAKLAWFGRRQLIPFKTFAQEKDVSPPWWKAYNSVKHTWSKALEKADLDNALEALSGAFLLNAIHYPSIKYLWQIGVLKSGFKRGDFFIERKLPEYALNYAIENLKPLDYTSKIETSLFECVRIVIGKPVPEMGI